MIDQIRANAELVISLAKRDLGRIICYDQSGVEWLDGYIQKLHNGKTPASEKLISVLGSYLGECIIRKFGGHWAEIDGNWCVQFDDQNAAFPFSKVAKQLDHGAEDSVLSYFTATPLVFLQLRNPE